MTLLTDEVFDIPNIEPKILKSASEEAKRIINENRLWFAHLYFQAVKKEDDTHERILYRFWQPNIIHGDRPKYWVPPEVLDELIVISQKNHSMRRTE